MQTLAETILTGYIENKIKEAQNILLQLGLPEQQQNRLCALTLLALTGVEPQNEWSTATNNSKTLTNDIMAFIQEYYLTSYKPNTRESFRKQALNPFIKNGIIALNPDNPSLKTTSSKTHYALTPLAVNTIKKYNTDDWAIALENFLRFQIEKKESETSSVYIKSINIKNYKSIVDSFIELGTINVFIGANGSGKSNILEALAFCGAAVSNDLTLDGLHSRGVRAARPNLMLNSFINTSNNSSIDINLVINDNGQIQNYKSSLTPVNQSDIFSKWIDLAQEEIYPEVLLSYFSEITKLKPGISGDDLLSEANKIIAERGLAKSRTYDSILSEYSIYDLNTKTLRGITSSESKKTPLGLNGEGLDLLIGSLSKSERADLQERTFEFFDWLEDIVTDKDDILKASGHKAGKSSSTLYFKDKYLNKENSIFSAENSNEGILHVLFYLALFISNKTPKVFAIDNIETALNPRLCKILIEQLTELAKRNGKQVLITTHNPAFLDGLNIFDTEQRLFEVYRSDEGYTITRRIQFKENLEDKTENLSQMWIEGLLGAVPNNFY